MAVSLILTEQIIKLFIILLLGFLLVKFGLLKASDSKSVSVILVYLILPCMIINAFQIDYTPQVRTGLIFTIAASVIVHLIFIAVTALLKRLLGLDTIEQMTVIYTNGGIMQRPETGAEEYFFECKHGSYLCGDYFIFHPDPFAGCYRRNHRYAGKHGRPYGHAAGWYGDFRSPFKACLYDRT